MNTEEEKQKNVDKIISEDNDERSDIDDPEELAEKKKSIHKFKAEGNIASIQLFIQNMVLHSNEDAEFQSSKKGKKKKYNLYELNDCIKFVEQFGYSYNLMVVLILCMFDIVEPFEIYNLYNSLKNFLPQNTLDEKKSDSPYISLNTVLDMLDGKQFVQKDEKIYVVWVKDSKKILFQLWKQFRVLYDSCIQWLLWLSKEEGYSTYRWVERLANAFEKVLACKIFDDKSYLLFKLSQDPFNAMLLGTVAYKLYQDKKWAEKWGTLVHSWIYSQKYWLKRAAAVIITLAVERKGVSPYEKKEIEKMFASWLPYLKNSDAAFLAPLLCQSKQIRNMLINGMNVSTRNILSREDHLKLSQNYLRIVRQCYYYIDEKFQELPLIICDTSEQNIKLQPILEYLIFQPLQWRQLCAIIKAYTKEISEYTFSDRLISRFTAYCGNIINIDSDFAEELFRELKSYHNIVCEKTVEKLYQILCKW